MCLVMGLVLVLWIFMKLLKFVFVILRKCGYVNVIYIDDLFLISKMELEC